MSDRCRRPFACRVDVRRQRPRTAFTLLEVVLAVGLSAVVMYLIATAIQLYLFRVDSSRGEVESAQLARILLDRISRDVAAARYRDPEAGPTTGSDPATTSTDSPAGSGNLSPPDASSTLSAPSLSAVGLFGDAEELRVDRATPAWSWERTVVDTSELERTSQHPPVPTSVRYYFADGTRLTTAAQAGLGLAEVDENVAGLYVQTAPTAKLVELAEAADNPWEGLDQRPVLLAPEVVGLEFAYFDGTELVASWDIIEQQAMPRGVEIRLQLYEPPRTLDTTDDDMPTDRVNSEWVREYRRFVWIPTVRPTESATLLAVPEQAASNDGGTGSASSPGSAGNDDASGESGDAS